MKIWIDIDDTICFYKNKTDKLNYNLALPNHNKISIVNKLYDVGHHITMWTARGTLTGIDWYTFTKNQLDNWGLKYHELKMGKPAFDIFIDDKALTTLEQLDSSLFVL